MVLPVFLFLLVERLQTRGEAVVKAVHQSHGFFECVVRGDGQQRCEQLGAEGEGVGFHADFHRWFEDVFLLIHKFRSDEPFLTSLKLEGAFQFLVLVGDHRPHDVAGVPHTAHFQR